jgi:hypothetical protein
MSVQFQGSFEKLLDNMRSEFHSIFGDPKVFSINKTTSIKIQRLQQKGPIFILPK